LGNLDENRWYWNKYAKRWTQQFRGFEAGEGGIAPAEYEYLGDEWGHPEDVTAILEEFVYPYTTADAVVVEIGSGGGRIAGRIAPRVKHLYCIDISTEMLERLKLVLSEQDNVSFLHVDDATFSPELIVAHPDFIYSFDVFVHLDVHTMWKYMQQIGLALRPGGKAFLHTTNLTTTGGWNRFSAQEKFTLEGHYFVTPELVRTLASHAGLQVETEANETPDNFYKARDYLVLLRK
jgi:SAM-dependent methyltransferase